MREQAQNKRNSHSAQCGVGVRDFEVGRVEVPWVWGEECASPRGNFPWEAGFSEKKFSYMS